jgi:hypothetical protein
MIKRQEAMKWWNNLSSTYKTQICDSNEELIGSFREWETLPGREIEILYDDKCRSDFEIIDEAFKNRGTNPVI